MVINKISPLAHFSFILFSSCTGPTSRLRCSQSGRALYDQNGAVRNRKGWGNRYCWKRWIKTSIVHITEKKGRCEDIFLLILVLVRFSTHVKYFAKSKLCFKWNWLIEYSLDKLQTIWVIDCVYWSKNWQGSVIWKIKCTSDSEVGMRGGLRDGEGRGGFKTDLNTIWLNLIDLSCLSGEKNDI